MGSTKSQRCTTRTLERSQESRATLAQRGELFTTLPAGYEKVDCGLIEPSPDQRQWDAIGLVFAKFAELRSVRQLWLWFRREQVEIPVRLPGAGLVWKLPTDTGLRSMLGNPIYAGAYAFGRSRQETVIENGRKRVRRSGRITNPEEWAVLLKDRHEGYITWDEYERNQDLIAANNTKVRGAVRESDAGSRTPSGNVLSDAEKERIRSEEIHSAEEQRYREDVRREVGREAGEGRRGLASSPC